MPKQKHCLAPVTALVTALLLPSWSAADIYSYIDENGVRHYTDQPPDTDQVFTRTFMETEPEPRVTLRRLGTREEPVYFLFNMFRGPVEIELYFIESQNVRSDPPLPARMVVAANSESRVVSLSALEPRRGFSYRLGVTHVPGRPVAMPDENLILHPPFPAGHSYLISQGVEGRHTHNDAQSEFAIDIVMPVGTPVLAAQRGVVMDIEEDFNSGGTNRDKYVMKGNHVRLLHDDGTMTNYGHLDFNSVNVRLGQRVLAGALIGRSGNTGFSTGPHLHFSVQRNLGLHLQGIPFEFRSTRGPLVLPIGGERISGTLARR